MSTVVYLRNRSPTKAVKDLTHFRGMETAYSCTSLCIWMQGIIYASIHKVDRVKLGHKARLLYYKWVMTNSSQFHNRTKHVSITYHFIQNEMLKGSVNVIYCPTTDMVADALTKRNNL